MKRLNLSADAIPRARRLRRDMTPQERKLWYALRETFPDAHFRRQVPLGPYTADFAWHRAKLIIEVDGGQHGTPEGMARDAGRTKFIEGEGYRVIRFWNSDIDDNLDGVLTRISNSLPLVGRDGVGARGVCRAKDSGSEAADTIFSAADAAGPHPSPPHKGEGIIGQPSVGVY